MNQAANIHARIDRETKKLSESILKSIGMTPSEAIRLFYRQIALRKEFPLELKVPNKFTTETLLKSDRNEEVEFFDSIKELSDSWK